MENGDDHLCPGLSCPFVVDTGEDNLCSRCGIVVVAVMMASFDFFSSSSRVRSTKNETFTPSTNSFVKAAVRVSADTPPENHTVEEIYGECFRVVSRLLKESGERDTAWRDTVVKRCVDTCTMCSIMEKKKVKNANTKSEYMCLAVLYLIREGLIVKGTIVCEKDARVALALPSLNALTLFGFKKGKFTRASRFLLQAVDKVMLTKPLHKVRV
jgi:hypothetical protein